MAVCPPGGLHLFRHSSFCSPSMPSLDSNPSLMPRLPWPAWVVLLVGMGVSTAGSWVVFRAIGSSAHLRLLPWAVLLLGALASVLATALVALWLQRREPWHARLRRNTRAMRDSDARFQDLCEQAALGVVQVDSISLQVLSVNQRYCSLTGYAAHELLQRSALDLCMPQERGEFLRLLKALIAGEIRDIRGEHVLECKDGSQVWVEVNVSLIGLQQPRQILAWVQDISERKRLQQLEQQGHRQLRRLMQRLPVGLVMEAHDGRLVYWNEEFLRLAGNASRPDASSDQWWQRMFDNQAARERIRQRWKNATGKARAALNATSAEPTVCHVATQEVLLLGNDGQRRAVALSGVLLDEGCLMVLQDQSERKAAEQEVKQLVFYDPVTGLPNRRLLEDRMQHALVAVQRRNGFGGALVLDVDNLKSFNENFGQAHGDAVLRSLGERLQAGVPAGATVARQRGDDFVVILDDLGDDPVAAASRLESHAQHLMERLRVPLRVDGVQHHVTVSMGISQFGGKALNASEVLRRAEMAMYQAKGLGRNMVQFFDPQLQTALQLRRSLEQDMREGLEQQQFELFYQPQVESGQVVGAEALLRWKHVQRGYVSPGEFVPLAEETGFILTLGDWVLRKACQQLASWARQPAFAQMTLAVNVSPKQFHQRDFVQRVLTALAEHGADPRLLKLELTEGLLLTDVDDTVAKMVRLKSHGIGFSLDDFGTGYSSLSYLKRLPLDQLKIDRSFVHDVLSNPNDASIARTIVALAASLGLHVIAEGVETQEQCRFLADINCHAWQGYLMSPPVAVAAFEELVRNARAHESLKPCMHTAADVVAGGPAMSAAQASGTESVA